MTRFFFFTGKQMCTFLIHTLLLTQSCNDMKHGYSARGCCSDKTLKTIGADGVMVTEEPCPETMTMFDGTSMSTGADPNAGCIYLGMINDYTGPYALVSTALETAQRLFWKYSNEDKRLHSPYGQYSVVIRSGQDSGYNPVKHAAAYETFRNNSIAIAMSLGTPQTLAVLDQMDVDDMVATPMSWWSGWADPSADKNLVVEFGSSYCVDAMNAYTYVRSMNESFTKFAYAGFTGDYGGDGLNGLEHMLSRDGLPEAWSYLAHTLEFDTDVAIEAIVAGDFDVVMLAVAPFQAATIVGEVTSQGRSPQWITLAPAFNDAFVAPDFALKDTFESSVITTAWVPPYTYDSVAHAKMRYEMKAAGIDSGSSFLVAGWSSQYPLESALRTLASSGKAMTRANLRATVQGLSIDSDSMMVPYTLHTPVTTTALAKPDGSVEGGTTFLAFQTTSEPVADVCFKEVPSAL